MPDNPISDYQGDPSHDRYAQGRAKEPAYKHRDYPRAMYKGDSVKLAKDADAEQKLAAAGYVREAPLPEKDEDAAGPARPAPGAPKDQAKPAVKK